PTSRASCTAKSPPPPVAPVTSTRRPRSSPRFASAWSAVSPATGKVAAWENVTFSDSSARACVGTATRSAHAPSGRSPTTRAPTRGPEPSAAARSAAPARSQPGRQPAAATPARLASPRLREIARTRTTASPRSGTGAATGLMTSRPGASGSTTTARLSLTSHLLSRSALPSRPCCGELRHDLLGEPAELLEHHRLRCTHADAHVDVLESREHEHQHGHTEGGDAQIGRRHV